MQRYSEKKTVEELQKLLHGVGLNYYLTYDKKHDMVYVYRDIEKTNLLEAVNVAMDNQAFILFDVLHNIL